VDHDPKNEQKLNNCVEWLMDTGLVGLGRTVIKLYRRAKPERPIQPGRVPKAHTELPTGPFLTSRPGKRGDLLIFVPRGWDSRLIDGLTGGKGYSHVTVDCGEVDQPSGKAVMVESTVDQTVSRKFLDEYGERPFVRIPLSKVGVDPDQFCGCVEEKLGQHYDYLEALTLGAVDDPARQVCSDLAAVCLPEDLRKDIALKRRLGILRRASVSVHSSPSTHGLREFISPNGFAEYFGAPHGKDISEPDQLVDPHPLPLSPLPVVRRHPWWILLCLAAGASAWFWLENKRRAT
jgi:hypothetical protein